MASFGRFGVLAASATSKRACTRISTARNESYDSRAAISKEMREPDAHSVARAFLLLYVVHCNAEEKGWQHGVLPSIFSVHRECRNRMR